MDCKTAQMELTAILAGERVAYPPEAVESHVSGCADCLKARQEMEAVWERLDLLAYEPVPEDLRVRTLRAVHREAAMEGTVSAGYLTLRRLGSAVGAGILVALLYTYVLGQRVDFGYLSAVHLAVTAVIWSGLLVAVFCWMLGQYRQWGVHLGAASALGLAAMGLSLVGTLLCPGETFFDLWERSPLVNTLNGVVGAASGYLIFGFVYALLPALIASAVLGGRLKGRVWRNAMVAAGAFVLLLAPAAYLQCASLAAGLLGTWVLGALGGALGGVLGGVKVRQVWAQRAAA